MRDEDKGDESKTVKKFYSTLKKNIENIGRVSPIK